MANPISKQQSTASRLERSVERAVDWIASNQETFWGLIGGTVLAGAFVAFVLHQHQVTATEAWVQLGVVQSQAMQNHPDQERKSLADWEAHFSGTSAASYAKFLKADLLYRTSDYATAAQIYGELAQNARPAPLRPLALAGQASSEEMAGHAPAALTLAQHFTDQYPDHFLAGSMYMTQARMDEAAGNTASAAALYDRIVLLYPQSPWTAIARARQQVLSPGSAPATSARTMTPELPIPAHP